MSRRGANEYYNESNNAKIGKKSKKKWSKKKKVLVTILVILLILVLIALGGYLYAKHKLGFMNYSPIDDKDLAVNSDLYNQSNTDLTKDQFNNVKNIVLFGSDSKNLSDMSEGRSDTIVITSINPTKKSLKLISIPRDTYVSIAGHGKTKINAAYAYGQEKLAISTINSNFGLNLDKYITINFSGLIDVIDKIGGVTVTIDKDEMNYINDGVRSWTDTGSSSKATLSKYGTVTLNGKQALIYSRNRTTGNGNDFQRANRQRTVIEAILSKVSKMPYDKVLSLSDSILKDVKTNITSDEYIALLASVFKDKDEYLKNVISAQVPSTDYAKGQMIGGIYYFVPDMDKSKADFVEYMYNK